MDGAYSLLLWSRSRAPLLSAADTAAAVVPVPVQVFTRAGEDTIWVTDLENVMTQMGEPLSAEEMRQMIAMASDGDDADNQISYERLIKQLMASYQR